MSGIIGVGSTGSTVATRKLYKDSKTKLVHMEPGPEKVASNLKNKDTMQKVLAVEHFIKENSGEYQKKSIRSHFSGIITLKELDAIIDELHKSGKIAIDKDDKIGWIWNPKLTKKYRNRTDLALR